MLKTIKGTVSRFRQHSKEQLEEDKYNPLPGKQYEKVTTYTSIFDLDATSVKLSSRRQAPEISEGDELAVFGVMLFGELRGINYRNLSTGYFNDKTLTAPLIIGAVMLVLSFFVTAENLRQLNPSFQDDFFAPFLIFVKWVMLRFMGTLFFLNGLKDSIASSRLKNV